MVSRYRLALLGGLTALSLVAFSGCGKRSAATVNGERIPNERFYELLERTHGAALMAQLISDALILQEAKAQNAMPADAEIERRYREAKGLSESLGQLPEAEAKQQVRVMLALKNLALKGIKAPEDEVKKAFEQHKAEFDQPEAVVVRRAVFKTQAEAETARATLQTANVEFSVVLGKSVDFSEIRENGGTIPALIRKDPAQPIFFVMTNPQTGQPVSQPGDALLGAGVSEKLFGLPEKSVTDVMACPRPKGFQVIQVQKHNQAKKGSYAEWRERIEEQILLEKRFKDEKIPQGVDPMGFFRAQTIDKLRRKANIQVGVERLKDVPKRAELWPRMPGAGQ